MIAFLLNAILIGGLLILLAASASALKEAIRIRARARGFLLTVGLLVLSLAGLWAVLI